MLVNRWVGTITMTTMYCRRCNRNFMLPVGSVSSAVMCPECGTLVQGGFAQEAALVQPRGSGLSVTSFIFGLVGIVPCFCGLPSLLAVIFGAVALIKDSAAKALAITGLVLGGLGLLMAPISAALMLPAIQAAREAARRASCASHLHEVATGVMKYQSAHNDEYPPDLDTLVSDGLIKPEVLTCPSKRHAAELDYIYAPPADKESFSAVIACDATMRHAGMRNVLYADGMVKAMPEHEFREALEDPENRNFKAALERVEGHGGGL